MKKRIILSLMIAIAAIVMSLTVKGNATVKAEATGVNKDTFATYFTKVGDTVDGVNYSDYVKDITYGSFTATHFSGSGIMVETRNKATALIDVTDNDNDTNPALINFPGAKYTTGAKFNSIVDLSDNTIETTLVELAFLATDDNCSARGMQVVIEDAADPDKFITLFMYYTGWDATGGKNLLLAAGASWENNTAEAKVSILEAGFDTEEYNSSNKKLLIKVGAGFSGDDADGGENTSSVDYEGCYPCYEEHGHTQSMIRLSAASENTLKVQFDNKTGELSVNGVHVRNFGKYSALRDSQNGTTTKVGSNVFDRFSSNKVKISVGVTRTAKRTTDEFTKFCIMTIDGNSLAADDSDNITYKDLDFSNPSSTTKDTMLSSFTLVGGENAIEKTYGDFTADKFSGGGVMVKIRNKATDLVDHTETSNDTNPMLVNFPNTKYPAGIMFNNPIDISDNGAYDTLIEFAFPGENDNFQVRGFKVVIEDAYNPNKYISLYIWTAYGNTESLDTGKTSMLGAAVGSWETTNPDSITSAGFDTDDYDNNGTADDGLFVRVGNYDGNGNGKGYNKEGVESDNKEILWVNAGGPHGHRVTGLKFSKKSNNKFTVQFDNATGTLYVNGVRVRNFKDYSADQTHYFDGFTNDQVKVSAGVARSVRQSTDEFTRFCVMSLDGNSLKADSENNIYYYGGFDVVPASGLLASGNTTIPAPMHHDLFAQATAIESGVTYTITDPNNKVTENYTSATFDFDLIGTYKVEYFVNGKSLGTTQFTTAAKDSEGNLSELVSLNVASGLYAGKKITLADFTAMADAQLPITSATITIYNGDEVLATETADAEWSYALPVKGELTFKVSTDAFTAKTTATVLPGVFPSAAIENGTVSINNLGSAIGLNSDLLTFVLTPAEGYRLKSLVVNGADVTEDVEDGEYEFEPETMDNNVIYTATFEAIPKYTVTYKDGETTVGTVADVVEGTLFKDVTAPTAPEKAGYTFTGWSVEANSPVNQDVTATAQYEVITCTITYNLDGGTNNAQNKATYTVEDAFTLANPTKEGYTFLGWSNEASEAVTAVALGTTGNLTFTAHWEADEPEPPVTQAPATQAPATEAPATQAPVTQAPATQAPATQAPATEAPATQAPATQAPSKTDAPAQTGKKGCKGFVETLPIFAFLLIPASIVVIKRKRDE